MTMQEPRPRAGGCGFAFLAALLPALETSAFNDLEALKTFSEKEEA